MAGRRILTTRVKARNTTEMSITKMEGTITREATTDTEKVPYLLLNLMDAISMATSPHSKKLIRVAEYKTACFENYLFKKPDSISL